MIEPMKRESGANSAFRDHTLYGLWMTRNVDKV